MKALGLHRLARYFTASALNTIAGLGIIGIVYYITKAAYVTIATSAILGYLYSILSFHYIAFSGKGRQIPYKKYAFTYFSAFLINMVLTRFLLAWVGHFLIVQAVVLPIVIGLQWLTANFWVFKYD